MPKLKDRRPRTPSATAPIKLPQGLKLRPYQQEGVEFLRRSGRAMLCDEMGLGKTAQMILASEGRTLVIAPAMVLDTGTWTREIAKWGGDPDRFTQVSYSSLNAREGSKLLREVNAALDGHWDTLILDEAHYCKNTKARRTQAVKALSKRSDRVYLATGTPIPNWPHEIFVPLQMMFPEDAKPKGKLGSYWRWIDEWFTTAASPYSDFDFVVKGLKDCKPSCKLNDPLKPCEHYLAFAAANFQDRFLQRLRDDVLTDLPPLTEEQIPVPMTVAQEREYKRMKKDFIATVDDDEVVAWNDAAKNTLLDKITTGLGMIQDPTSLNGSGKFEMLREDLAERYRPTLVVAHYRSSVEACAQLARDLGRSARVLHGGTPKADRLSAAEEFQNGKVDVLVGSFDTISEGLQLTAADMCILVEYSYKPHRNQQVIRRIHRLGQDRPCTIRDYVSVTQKGGKTLDGHKRDLVNNKTYSQTQTLSAARFKQMLSEV